MEREMTVEELIRLINGQSSDYILQVYFGEEDEADGRLETGGREG